MTIEELKRLYAADIAKSEFEKDSRKFSIKKEYSLTKEILKLPERDLIIKKIYSEIIEPPRYISSSTRELIKGRVVKSDSPEESEELKVPNKNMPTITIEEHTL